jgi:putative monooxygenase
MVPSFALVVVLGQTFASPPGPVVGKSDAAAFKILKGAGTARLYVNATNGSKDAAVSVLVLDKGAEVPAHVHETSDEVLYVTSGSVEMTVAGKAVQAKSGDVVFIPRNTKHSAKATTKLEAVQVYAPPGPEQRFASGERVKD